MVDKSSPFTGLDKALLRSSQTAKDVPEPAKPEEHPQKAVPSQRAAKSTPASTSEIDSKQESYQASKIASKLSRSTDELIETIRKAVKVPGKEVLFVRLTKEEKGQLVDIVYTYKRQGKKTSENEINRIAVNYMLEDYQAHGQNSILARVIDALLA
jgi:hypothetical protein